MNADAYRYRPLASALRSQRARLNPQWEASARTETRAQDRLRSAGSQYLRDSLMRPGGAYDAAVARSSWRDSLSGLPAAVLGSAGPIALGWQSVGNKSGGKKPPSLPGAFTDYFQRHGYYPDTSSTTWRRRSRDGTYDAGEDVLPAPPPAPARGSGGPRPPKRWVNPDQPWPATAANGGGSGSGGGRRRSHFGATSRIVYE